MIRLSGRMESDLVVLRYRELLARSEEREQLLRGGVGTGRRVDRRAGARGAIAQQDAVGRRSAGQPGALDAGRQAG